MKTALKLGLGTVALFFTCQIVARCIWSVYWTWLGAP